MMERAEIKTLIEMELARIARQGTFDEGYWQSIFDLAGREAYRRARQARALETDQKERLANEAMATAVTVEEKRAARKLLKHASTAKGLERLYWRRSDQDPLLREYKRESDWIATARDLGVLLTRWHQENK